MIAFKKILFPVDLSESSEKIVPYVQVVAKKFESQIYLLFSVRAFEYFATIDVPFLSISKFEKEIFEGAQKRLPEFAKKYFNEFPDIHTAVLTGDAAEQIVRYISEQQIDLVIMGTHGRKGIDRIVFGSVAERVVKNSPVPVMVVNPYKPKI